VWLFRPPDVPSAAARRYIAEGEAAGTPSAYKCRVREPWWRAPVLPPPDLFITCMNADAPRLVNNEAGVHHLNSVHGLYARDAVRPLAIECLPLVALNSLALAGAEIVGRAYGGGLLKLEPREADRLPLPLPGVIAAVERDLRALAPTVADALARGDLGAASRAVDSVVLGQGLGLDDSTIAGLREARRVLSARRAARGRSANRR
jgi:hypothetical protein